MKDKPFIIPLCGGCRAKYEYLGDRHIRRADPKQTDKEVCFHCQDKSGWDYEITPKERRGKR